MLQTGTLLPGGPLAATCGATRRHAWCLPGQQRGSAAASALRTSAPQQGEQDQRRATAGRRSTATCAAYGSSVDLSSWSSAGDRGAPLDFRLDGSHVAGARGRPRGIVHFVGGAFAGANPQLTVRTFFGWTHSSLQTAGWTSIERCLIYDLRTASHRCFRWLTNMPVLRAHGQAAISTLS